jgi:uncharacterized phage protein gp47/JayE
MPDLPSFDDLFRVHRDEILSRNPNLTATVIETQGTETNLLAGGSAAVGDEVTGQLALVAASLFLDSAAGNELDRLVFDRYGLVRKAAAPAIGQVSFTCSPASAGAFTIPTGTLLQTSTGLQFVTTTSVAFPGGSTGPITAPVRSTLAGANQQAAIGTVRNIVSPIPGATPGMAVNNPLATAGAADKETDDSLRARARSFFTTVRRGTLAAIQAAALAVPGVASATAFEIIDVLGRPAKEVQLAIADQFTDSLVGVSPTPLTYQAQSQALATQVFAALDDVRAAGIFVDVEVAQIVLQGIQLGLRYSAGVDTDAVALTARATVAAYINSLAPGVTLSITALVSVLRTVPGLVVTGEEIVSPTGDVVPSALQAIRTSLALVLAVGV